MSDGERRWSGNYFLKAVVVLISSGPLWLKIIRFNIKQDSHKIYRHQGRLVPTCTREALPRVACAFAIPVADADRITRNPA